MPTVIFSEYDSVSNDDRYRKQNFLTAKLPNQPQRLGPISDKTFSINDAVQ